MISWSYYSDQCYEYLFGKRTIMINRYIFCILAVIGAIGSIGLVWNLASFFMFFMAFANLTALLGLTGLVVKETESYTSRMKEQGDL